MNILITGGTGLLGTHLIQILQKKKFSVSLLGRNPTAKNGITGFAWNPEENILDEASLTNTDCIIHLAGAGINDKPWSEKRKKVIRDSRVKTAELIYEYLKKNKHRIQIFISASGISGYGNTGDEWIDENSPMANDFLGNVCRDWEEAADKISSLGIRVVKLRIGVVLAADGGALPVLSKPVKLFAGAPLGTGKQFISWVHINDLCRIILKAIEDKSMEGAYNATAPVPVSNKKFMQTLAHVLKKPMWLPNVPAFILKIILGEKAVLALEGQRVTSKKICDAGFEFEFAELRGALNGIFSNKNI